MSDYSPVLIPTLNRHVHFKNCVESLAACALADQTDLFIALDYPLNEHHWEGYEKICEYLTQITGFKSVTVFRREVNFGVRQNINIARTAIFMKYNQLILSEDDNIFSLDFLVFMNKGLEVYRDRKDILSISGYNYPVNLPKSYIYDVYLFGGFSAWGYGIWKDRWENISWDIEELKLFLNNKEQVKRLLSPNLIKGLNRIVETGYITGDTYLCYHQAVHKMYSVFPVVSRVKNNGHDGSGVHGGNNKKIRDIYLTQKISDGTLKVTFPLDITVDQYVLDFLRKYFEITLVKKVIYNPHIVVRKIHVIFRSLVAYLRKFYRSDKV